VHRAAPAFRGRVPSHAQSSLILAATLGAMVLCGAVINAVARAHQLLGLLGALGAVVLIVSALLALVRRVVGGVR
jgi:hypothetical protein